MKYRRNPARRDRSTEPHSRIPDSIYSVLSSFKPYELKLWLALKSREWRKDGSRRGLVKKSLNRIARDIGMSRDAAQRAFRLLKDKELVEWAGFGIRLLEPDFTKGFTTALTTEDHRRRRPSRRPGVAVSKAVSDRSQRPATTVIPFPGNESGCGRSVLTIRRARDEPTHAVDAPKGYADNAPRKSARGYARGSAALSSNTRSQRKDKAEMVDETDSTETLDVIPLDREAAFELLKKVRARAEAAADEAAAKREADRAAVRQKEADRIAELKRQGAELLAAEGKAEP